MFFVYVDWTKELTPRPFYVGKGNENRIKDFKRNRKHTAIKNKISFKQKIITF